MTIPQIPVVPEDLSSLDDDALHALLAEFGTAAQAYSGLTPGDHTDESIAAVQALSDAVAPVTAEFEIRQARAEVTNAVSEAAASLASFATEFAASDETSDEPDTVEVDEVEDTEQSVTASTRPPSVAEIKRRNKTPEVKDDGPTFTLSMTAAADVPGFSTGHRFADWNEAATALANRHSAYGADSASIRKGGRSVNAEIEVHRASNIPRDPRQADIKYSHKLQSFSRHGGVKLHREAREGYRLDSSNDRKNLEILETVGRESRLNGGSLVASMLADTKAGKSLTAAAGWCSESETMYGLDEQETLDGRLPLPEVTADRGGFRIPTDGGTDFSAIYTGIGNAGNTHLSEQDVINDTAKVATEIPCPPFTNVRLGVDYFALTGSLLQRRGYPEQIGRWHRGAYVALEHKINAGVIAAIVAGSSNGGTIPASTGGDDAASSSLSAIEVAIVDARYRGRLSATQTMEVPIPLWGLAQIRAAMARRRGTATMAVTDAEIANWFAVRGAVLRPVYDWQDAFTGLAAGPGGATPLTALPTSMTFAVYPAGTWVKAVAEVVDLDTIYDSTKLATNEYTAAFVETGWAVMKMAPISRVYTTPVDPTGCLCDGAEAPAG